MDKKIINPLNIYENDYSLNNRNIYKFVPMTEKIKNEIRTKKYNNINSRENIENLKHKLKYKYYKPSFLNSFVSGKKVKNQSLRNNKNNIELISTNSGTYEKKNNNNYTNISNFNEINSY